MKNLNKPLTEAEFKSLDNFLISDDVPEECMDISTLNGFLTALVIGPEPIMPSEWLPVVWGEEEDDEMTWESQAQAEKYISYVMRYMNATAELFQNAPEEFEALTYEREVDGHTTSIIDEWCWGFMKGMALRFKAWQPIYASEEGSSAMSVVTLYGTEAGWKKLKDNPELADQHDKFAGLLDSCVTAIHDFWLERRVVPMMPSPAKSQKVGRNEPCPCGSGKKYKKCCAGKPTLH